MKIIIQILLLSIAISSHAQTFFTQLEADENIYINLPLNVEIENDVIKILNVGSNGNLNFYETTLDLEGKILNTKYTDTLEQSPLQTIGAINDSLIFENFIYEDGGIYLRLDIVNTKGKHIGQHNIKVFGDNISKLKIKGRIFHDNYFILSGRVSVDNVLKGVIIWIDRSDFTLKKLETTTTDFWSIGGLVSVDDEVYGVSTFMNYEWDCTACLSNGMYYITKFSLQENMDTLTLIGEGNSYDDREIDVEKIGNFLVFAHKLNDKDEILLYDYINRDFVKSISSFELVGTNGSISSFLQMGNESHLIYYSSQIVGDDIGLYDRRISHISLINQEGEVEWTRKFVRYDQATNTGILDSYGVGNYIDENNEYIYFLGISARSVLIPFINKTTIDGCSTEDCFPLQVLGYWPKPNYMVSRRNIWYMHNTDTDKRFRYTFIDGFIPDIGGTLMRSDEMGGDNWYSTGRRFTNGFGVRELFEVISPKPDLEYGFFMKIGQKIELETYHETLHVIEKDSIQFEDGRIMRRLLLECRIDDEIQEDIDHVEWLEYVGEPNHLFNTKNACKERTNDVVTCFYSAGELVWTNPRAQDCSTVSTYNNNLKSQISLFPNPSSSYITINTNLTNYNVVDLKGNIVMTSASYKKGDLIDISGLSKGMYYLYTTAVKDRKLITFVKN